MYKYDQRKYFNWHAGIRATDRNHEVAQRYFERIKELESRGKTGQIQNEGFELAEDTRKKVAQVLHCNPRNVFFANSATMAAIPMLVSIFAKEHRLVYLDEAQYPSVTRYLFSNLSYKLNDVLTRNNYGYRSADPAVFFKFFTSFLNSLNKYARYFVSHDVKGIGIRFETPEPIYLDELRTDPLTPSELIELDELRRKWYSLPPEKRRFDPLPYKLVILETRQERDLRALSHYSLIKNCSKSGNSATLLVDHFDRYLARAFSSKTLRSIEGVTSGIFGNKPYTLLDGSHTFGVIDFDVTQLCEMFIASSSKGFAAEPTIGIGYVNDEILEIMADILPKVGYPRTAFQFSPETVLGAGNQEEMKYWISLPELASFNTALTDFLDTTIEEITKKLRRLNKELQKRMKHLDLSSSSYSLFERLVYRFLSSSYGIRPPGQPFSREGFFLKDFVETPNYLVRKTSFDERKIEEIVKNIRERDDYVIGTFSRNVFAQYPGGSLISFSPEYCSSLRFSFRHDVDQDVVGLLNALEDVLKRGLGK